MIRQLTAIMFTDMVGYTALMQEDERQAKLNRDRQREVLEDAVERFGGRILQFYGDGTLSVFSSAVSAVESAMEIQDALREADPPIPLRIGIHTGDVVHDDNGVFGDGVNVASRIEGLGVPGSVLVSGKVFDEIKNQPDIETRGLGSFNLKNIKHPTRVYAISNRGLSIPSESNVRPDRAARTRSVAVLPFVNMSSDPENEFFSDGITEEIINALTRVNGLQVTARTSSFAFKNHSQDIREIADKLGVTHVLEGSVRKAGNRVRVTAQLISAADGYHLMSEVYDGSLDDIFALQDEISQKIMEHLADHLGRVPTSEASVGEGLVHAQRHNGAAYEEYLRGRHALARWSPTGSTDAIRHYERSIGMDPDSALPYSGLAKACIFLGATGHLPPSQTYDPAEEAALKAIELDESAGEAHVAMALVRLFRDWDWAGAYEHFQKAITLTPGSAEVHQFYSMYLRTVDEAEESLVEADAALQLDPLSSPIRLIHAEAVTSTGDLDRAETELQALLADDPSFRAAVESLGFVKARAGDVAGALELFERLPGLAGHRFAGAAVRGHAYGLLGRTDDAAAMIDLLHERAREQPEISIAMDLAIVYHGMGDLEAAVEQLHLAADVQAGGVVFVGSGNYWHTRSLRDAPGFDDFLDRIGYPKDGLGA